jgi:hypothetical protein
MFGHKKFNREFEKNERAVKIINWIVIAVFALSLVSAIVFSILIGVVTVKAVDQVDEQGLRGVLEQLWCGKSVDCKMP